VNRNEEGIGTDILHVLSRKTGSKKRQFPIMRNWRDKNDYDSSALVGMIMPIGSHISPEEGQGFF